jgi:hypothetical protein
LLDAGQEGPPSNPEDNSLRISQILSQIMSSRVHGDPDTPILRVPEGKQTVLRVADVGDSPRGYAFHTAGHLFLRPAPISLAESDIPPDSQFQPFIERGTTQAMSAARSFSLEAVGGAGGLQDKPGDYLYQDQKLAKYVEGGAWGILRVMPYDFDPIYTVKYLIKEISYSSELSKTGKDMLIANLHNAFNLLTDQYRGNDKDVCDNILPTLLRYLDKIENHYDNKQQYYGSYNNNNNDYDYSDNNYHNIGYVDYENSASAYDESEYNNNNYNKDYHSEYYYDDYERYDSEKNKHDSDIERFKELLRNIAYSTC